MSAWSNSTWVRMSAVGEVVEELGALVEEGGVVLVAFEDEGAGGAELEAGAEVFGYATDEEGWVKRWVFATGDLVDPGEHAGGGGFAVGAATTRRSRLARNSSWMRAAMEVKGMRWSRTASTSGLPRERALPTTTRSGAGEVGFGCRARGWGCLSSEQVAHGRVGGFVGAGDAWPLARSRPASEAMAVPQMPMRWMCFLLCGDRPVTCLLMGAPRVRGCGVRGCRWRGARLGRRRLG
jgi:hypothetical protein